MSTINLASTLLTPDYSYMHLVGSEAMDEAGRREGSRFEGVIGTIRELGHQMIPLERPSSRPTMMVV